MQVLPPFVDVWPHEPRTSWPHGWASRARSFTPKDVRARPFHDGPSPYRSVSVIATLLLVVMLRCIGGAPSLTGLACVPRTARTKSPALLPARQRNARRTARSPGPQPLPPRACQQRPQECWHSTSDHHTAVAGKALPGRTGALRGSCHLPGGHGVRRVCRVRCHRTRAEPQSSAAAPRSHGDDPGPRLCNGCSPLARGMLLLTSRPIRRVPAAPRTCGDDCRKAARPGITACFLLARGARGRMPRSHCSRTP